MFGATQNLFLPVRLRHDALGGIAERIGVADPKARSWKPRKVRAISRNQPHWTVLSKRSMWARIARTRSRGGTSGPGRALFMPAEWASSV